MTRDILGDYLLVLRLLWSALKKTLGQLQSLPTCDALATFSQTLAKLHSLKHLEGSAERLEK